MGSSKIQSSPYTDLEHFENKPRNRHIVGVVADLFFMVKISDAAKRAGMTVEYVKEADQVLAKARLKPAMIIFDLNLATVDPVKLIAQLKGSDEFNGIALIAYLSHVQIELKRKAQEAGCDTVLARSAFSENLPMLLERHAEGA